MLRRVYYFKAIVLCTFVSIAPSLASACEEDYVGNITQVLNGSTKSAPSSSGQATSADTSAGPGEPQAFSATLEDMGAKSVLFAHSQFKELAKNATPTAQSTTGPKDRIEALYMDLERARVRCEEDFAKPDLGEKDFSTQPMESYLVRAQDFFDAALFNLERANAKLPETENASTHLAALIVARLKSRHYTQMSKTCDALGEYLGALGPKDRLFAEKFCGFRREFSNRFLQHKQANLFHYGTWTKGLYAFSKVNDITDGAHTFSFYQMYITRAWDSFFDMERAVRNTAIRLYSNEASLGLLRDSRFLHWTEQCPKFAQKLIQTWDTLFIYYAHHILAMPPMSQAQDQPPTPMPSSGIPGFLVSHNLSLGPLKAYVIQEHEAKSVTFPQAPLPPRPVPPHPLFVEKDSDSSVDENTVSIKSGSSGDEGTDLEEDEVISLKKVLRESTATTHTTPIVAPRPKASFNSFDLLGKSNNQGNAASPPSQLEMLSLTSKPPYDPVQVYMASMERSAALACEGDDASSGSCLPFCMKDPMCNLSELCAEGDTGEKDGYNVISYSGEDM
ncbi:MAG: hypothetical protein C0514_05100 [Candidatus Puniceispirillum sp.]|nr:hypothetical protein [Candidatus Puniceispirillum sp.]